MDVKSKISVLTEEFSNFLISGDDTVFCKNVSIILNAFANTKKFEVDIIEISTKGKEPFFGMRCFPHESYMQQIASRINTPSELVPLKDMCNSWKSIKKWCIEIDSRVFDRNMINFNPEELTAMLLHEIGHVTYSDTPFSQFYHVFCECRVKMSTADKAGAKIVNSLYMIPLTLACGFRNWSVGGNDLREEIFADQSVQKLGYGEHLISAYKKIIAAYGSGGYHSNNQLTNEIEKSITWCNLNAKDLVHRKNRLKDELYQTGASTSSRFVRRMIGLIMDRLKIRQQDKYEGNVVLESMINLNFDDDTLLEHSNLIYDVKGFGNISRSWTSARESAKNAIAQEAFGKKKTKIPSQLDVDTIFVEVDRIENHADRRYVLDLIFHQEEKINNFIELCEINPDLKKKHYGKMQSMLKELESMRQAVLAKRSFQKEYKVFVKCPVGYEG